MNESKLQAIDALNQELGAVRAHIALIPQLDKLRNQCMTIELALQKHACQFALQEAAALRFNITQLINSKPGGAQ